MELSTLQITWFCVLVFFATAYLIMDGFDLGVGALKIFSTTNSERKILLNSIAPFWDGNEVWLLVFGASLYGSFPTAYSVIMPAFYIPMLLFSAGLIFRAVAMEFRSKVNHQGWQNFWDYAFSISSSIITIGLGLVLGRLFLGLDLDANNHLANRLAAYFHPYCLLTGITLWCLLNLHSSVFLLAKTEDGLQRKCFSFFKNSYLAFAIIFSVFIVASFYYLPLFSSFVFNHQKFVGLVGIVLSISFFALPYLIKKEKFGWAFFCSALLISCCTVLFSKAFFPYLVYNSAHPEASLTIVNCSGSAIGLRNLLAIASIAIPLTILYTIYIQFVFRGKVKLDSHSY